MSTKSFGTADVSIITNYVHVGNVPDQLFVCSHASKEMHAKLPRQNALKRINNFNPPTPYHHNVKYRRKSQNIITSSHT
jgi:hypothetical protein